MTKENLRVSGKDRLPVSITTQVQDGCVTASARAFIPHFGVDFENVFLPKLREFSLDPNNSENNHMLGVAVVAIDLGLDVEVFTKKPLIDGKNLPENAPPHSKKDPSINHKFIISFTRSRKSFIN